jgi:hypothetical protein
MVLPLDSRDVRPLFGALVAGFVLFLLVGYLALFDMLAVDSDLVLISAGVVVGYVAARIGR